MKTEKSYFMLPFILKYAPFFCLIVIGLFFIVTPGASGDLENGKVIFDQICYPCHGKDGQGILAPPFVESDRFKVLEGIIAYTDFIMPPVNSDMCTGTRAEDSAQYVQDEFNFEFTEDMIVAPDIACSAEGGKIVFSQLCSVCHGIDGKGDLARPIVGSTRFKSMEEIISFINSIMPAHNPGKCTENCAAGAARYIMDTFTIKLSQNMAEEGKSNTPIKK